MSEPNISAACGHEWHHTDRCPDCGLLDTGYDRGYAAAIAAVRERVGAERGGSTSDEPRAVYCQTCGKTRFGGEWMHKDCPPDAVTYAEARAEGYADAIAAVREEVAELTHGWEADRPSYILGWDVHERRVLAAIDAAAERK